MYKIKRRLFETPESKLSQEQDKCCYTKAVVSSLTYSRQRDVWELVDGNRVWRTAVCHFIQDVSETEDVDALCGLRKKQSRVTEPAHYSPCC